jgi:hypothetical protein
MPLCTHPADVIERIVPLQIGGYARASYASGGGGTSRVPRIAGDVTAGSAPLPVGYASCAGRRRLLVCSGAASRRGLPYGGSTRFYGGSTRWRGHRAGLPGLRLRCGGRRAEAGGCHRAFVMMKRRAAGCRGPALRAARSRLTVLVVSAGRMPGPAGQAGAAAACRLRNAGPAVPCRVSGDGSPIR